MRSLSHFYRQNRREPVLPASAQPGQPQPSLSPDTASRVKPAATPLNRADHSVQA